ncbi:glutathione S-transferase family protein [Actibacterium lipolyticum]|uniref:Putative GST-like protein YibF n=1 Tax=Actibacterium lipolyticum TaxID=1524263 RepID=A0A238JQA8_9RHOB|nr:glutathione S-transferase family protein [Actibacterium lipolyticum]SMX32849.1 putative GST-like protein YibF [Actibacterium lipolyticum]
MKQQKPLSSGPALCGAGTGGRAILRSTLTSPYGRKVRMAAHTLGLFDKIQVVPGDTRDPNDDLRVQNPLGKMPCLLTNDATLFDSRVILEYLDAQAGGARIIPADGIARYRCLTLAALADGVTDAALLMVYEGRFRDRDQVSQVWLDHQSDKIARALSALSVAPPAPEKTDVASISLACALGYLDWRKSRAWREEWPQLVAWLSRFSANEPAFNLTEQPND